MDLDQLQHGRWQIAKKEKTAMASRCAAPQHALHSRPPMVLGLLLPLGLLLLRAPTLAGSAADPLPPDLLAPTFAWNQGLPPDDRYVRRLEGATSRNIALEGDVAIRTWENPKQIAYLRRRISTAGDLLDVLAVRPLPGYRRGREQLPSTPALATVTVHLDQASVGLNRFRILARADALYAAALTPECPLVRAVLAPKNRPSSILREIGLGLIAESKRLGGPHGNITVPHGLGEWVEIKGDFWLLERELGEEESFAGATKLFVTLVSRARARENIAGFAHAFPPLPAKRERFVP